MHYTVRFTKAYLHWGETLENEQLTSENRIAQMQEIYPVLKDDGNYLMQFGHLLLEEERYQEAKAVFLRAKRFTPDKAVNYALGRCYEQEGKPEEAAATYQQIQRAIPHLVKPRYLQAMLKYHQHDTIAFLDAANACVAFEPKVHNMAVIGMKQELQELIRKVESQKRASDTTFQ